jgi:DNA-binding transcriptional LysR family regulator
MELRQLRYFTVVARELSFTAASRHLHISQPPLSLQIANLERELGTRLFDRNSRSVELTEAGKALLQHALAVLDRVGEARQHVQLIAQGLKGRVKLGLSGSHFLGPLPRFIQQFRDARPAVDVVLHEMRPVDQLQALREGRIDISISRSALADEMVESRLLWRDPVVAALPRDHRLALRKSLRLQELRREAFVFLRLESSAFAQRLFDACVAAGFAPRMAQQVVEIPAVVNLVAAGLGVALVPVSMARLRPDSVAVCRLGPSMPNGDVHALVRAREAQPAVHEFLKHLLLWAQTQPAS